MKKNNKKFKKLILEIKKYLKQQNIKRFLVMASKLPKLVLALTPETTM